MDPLGDSDTEADEHVRLDYSTYLIHVLPLARADRSFLPGRRLRILSRLRGKEPTPPPMQQAGPSSASATPQYQMQSQFQASNQSSSSSPSSLEPKGKLRQVTW